jgi:hypothetical protein
MNLHVDGPPQMSRKQRPPAQSWQTAWAFSQRVEWGSLIDCPNELCAIRGRNLTQFDFQVARSVYSACSKALTDSAQNAHVWRAVSAPTGSGKTTAALAYAAAIVRSGGSVLFLAGTRRECDEAYRTLESLLHGKVAIRTTDHDQDELNARGPSYVNEIEAARGYRPSAFFACSHLSAYPALIGTHDGYKNHPDELLTLANGIRRELILVDEHPDDIDVGEFTLGDFEQLHELCVRKLKFDENGEEPLLTHY